MRKLLKSITPKPLLHLRKKVLSKILQKKWEKNDVVSAWISSGIVGERELSTLVFEWERYQSPTALPHKIKQRVVNEYREKYKAEILVETGTYYGDMIEAQKHRFKKLYSIELSNGLWRKAVHRFEKDAHVTILQGDSALVLQKLAPELSGPTVFWLDGHYCGDGTALSEIECPIYKEIDAIFSTNLGHTLLIDDARCFVGERDYPTIEELKAFVGKKDRRYRLTIADDIIRIENPENQAIS